MCRNENNRCCTGFWSVNGRCQECPIGYFGLSCNRKCPDGYYGRLCNNACNCTDGAECHFVRGCLNFVEGTHTVAENHIEESDEALHLIGPLIFGLIAMIALILLSIYVIKCWQKKTNLADIIGAITILSRSHIRSDHQVNTCDNLPDEGAVGGTDVVSFGNTDVRSSVNKYSTIETVPDYHTYSKMIIPLHSQCLKKDETVIPYPK